MRVWLKVLALCMLVCGISLANPETVWADTATPIRIGLTPVFLDDQTGFINDWKQYLQERLEQPVEFVQRASYQEIVDLVTQGKLDFAWLCGYPYVRNRTSLELLVVPLYQGQPLYRSYFIVPATDTRTRSLLDLRGRVFAFSDPDSNSGYLVPLYQLGKLEENPKTFFSKAFFTWSHRKVVEAVAADLAQGGAVDGYIWDMLTRQSPELTMRTRVVSQSPAYGFPPFVAARSVPAERVEALRHALIAMPRDEEGARLLKKLRLDGFVAGDETLYDDIARMRQAVGEK